VAGLLNSALSVFYYARVLKVLYFDPSPSTALATAGSTALPVADPLPAGGLGYGRAVAIGLIAVLIVAIGVYPQPVLGAIQSAAQHFVALGA
jgi:NADH:ubiquinone oxidoreductase subunit 2 (subunit N)